MLSRKAGEGNGAMTEAFSTGLPRYRHHHPSRAWRPSSADRSHSSRRPGDGVPPEFPYPEIEVGHLLEHSTGLLPDGPLLSSLAPAAKSTPTSCCSTSWWSTPRRSLSAPGAGFLYSGTGSVVAETVVERANQKLPGIEVLQRKPLRLASAGLFRRCGGYSHQKGLSARNVAADDRVSIRRSDRQRAVASRCASETLRLLAHGRWWTSMLRSALAIGPITISVAQTIEISTSAWSNSNPPIASTLEIRVRSSCDSSLGQDCRIGFGWGNAGAFRKAIGLSEKRPCWKFWMRMNPDRTMGSDDLELLCLLRSSPRRLGIAEKLARLGTMRETEEDLSRRLLAELHLNVSERRALPNGSVRLSVLVAVVERELEVSGWFPFEPKPGQGTKEGRCHGASWREVIQE